MKKEPNTVLPAINGSKHDKKKYRLLVISIVLDIVGVMTYAVPFFGEFFDLIWAPLSALLVWIIYRRSYGSLGGIFSFFEEILPGVDIIPTFTIMWFVKYYFVEERRVGAEVTAQ
jgi:hypothetical protein